MELRYYLALAVTFLFIIFLIFVSIYYLQGFFSSAPYVPTKRNMAKEVARYIKQNVEQGGKVYELGSGTGTVMLQIAKENPDKHIYGVEISLPLTVITKIKAKFLGVKNITVKTKNLYKTDLQEADAIFFYMLPVSIKRIQKKINREKKDDCLVLSNAFELEGMEKIDEISIPQNRISRRLLIYR